MSAAATLRKLLAREGEIVASPGVYDGVTARLALNAGFDTLYMVKTPQRFQNWCLTDTDRSWMFNVSPRSGRSWSSNYE